jgi:hypothetical protein
MERGVDGSGDNQLAASRSASRELMSVHAKEAPLFALTAFEVAARFLEPDDIKKPELSEKMELCIREFTRLHAREIERIQHDCFDQGRIAGELDRPGT